MSNKYILSESDSTSENDCPICYRKLYDYDDTELCSGCYSTCHYDCIYKIAYLGDGRDRDVLFYKCSDCKIKIVSNF